NQTLSLIQHVIKVRKIKVIQNLDKSMPNIFVDGNQLQQVIFNLMKNAIDAMPHGGEIFITNNHQPDSGRVEIAFQDTGVGISKENLKNIFKPFFTMKDPGKGTGLGLTICLDIIKNHGGTITAESIVGKGSKFVITLPD
ncbi:MAG: sensor histidine kinase, partial [Candidatus Brocadiales bacterium]